MAATASWSGINEAVAALHQLNKRVDAASKVTVAEVGSEVERIAKDNFVGSHEKGKPRENTGSMAPQIVTGTLRRSIRATPVAGIAGGYAETVGPTVEYGRRVELGFVGVDKLGRRYDQPAYSYFGPGVKEVRLLATGIAVRNWTAAIEG